MSIRVLVCDDWRLFRAAIRRLLQSDPEIEVVGEADGGKSAVELAARLRPDVVLMDVVMPDMNGIDATRQIVRETGAVKVLAVSTHADPRYVRSMMEAGAKGYVLKCYSQEDLAVAIRTVAAGETYVSPSLALAAAAVSASGILAA